MVLVTKLHYEILFKIIIETHTHIAIIYKHKNIIKTHILQLYVNTKLIKHTYCNYINKHLYLARTQLVHYV